MPWWRVSAKPETDRSVGTVRSSRLEARCGSFTVCRYGPLMSHGQRVSGPQELGRQHRWSQIGQTLRRHDVNARRGEVDDGQVLREDLLDLVVDTLAFGAIGR